MGGAGGGQGAEGAMEGRDHNMERDACPGQCQAMAVPVCNLLYIYEGRMFRWGGTSLGEEIYSY